MILLQLLQTVLNHSYELSYIDSSHYFINKWSGVAEELTYENGIGLVHLFGEEGTAWSHTLTGAIVDNVEYGQILEIHNDNITPDSPFIVESYPNPFNSTINIHFVIPFKGDVKFDIIDMKGRIIERTQLGETESGKYEISWNSQNNPSGVYLVIVHLNELTSTKKTVLIK